MNGSVLNGTDVNGSTFIDNDRYDLSASGLVDLIVAKARVVSGSVQAKGTVSISIIKESYPAFNAQATGSVELDPAIRVYVPSMNINATGSAQVQIYKELGILVEVQANLEAKALMTKVGVLQGDLRGAFSTEALITKHGFILPKASLNASLEGNFIKESYPSFLIEGSALAELLVSKDYYPSNLNISATGSIEAQVARPHYILTSISATGSVGLLVAKQYYVSPTVLATLTAEAKIRADCIVRGDIQATLRAEALINKVQQTGGEILATGSIEALVAKPYYPPKLDILGQLSTDLLIYRRHILLGDILATGSIRRLFTLVHPFGLRKDQFVHQMYRDIPPEIMFKEEE